MEHYQLGLLARDIHNSVTPIVYQSYAKDLGITIDYRITNMEPDKMEETVRYFRENLNGFTVTMPYKQTILQYADKIDETAKGCGSSNTILVKNGKLIAYNTDGWGLIKAFSLAGISVSGKKIVLVGAGGVALSIAYNLKLNGVKDVAVLNVELEQAKQLVGRFGDPFHCELLTDKSLESVCEDADIFINACILGQVGYNDYQSLAFLNRLKQDAVIFDVNYSNPQAKLVPAARQGGHRAYVGSSMSICQGIRAMEYWTGRAPSDRTALAVIAQWEKENAKIGK